MRGFSENENRIMSAMPSEIGRSAVGLSSDMLPELCT